MKVSKAQVTSNHASIIREAARHLRGQGFDKLSVAEIAQGAGLTHGALYSHFASKEALKVAAIESAFDDCMSAFAGLTPLEFLDRYLSAEHRDHPDQGCPSSALASEVRRQPIESKMAFRAGLERFVALAAESLKSGGTDHGKEQALFMVAAIVGGLALSRALRDVDQPGSKALLDSVAAQLKWFLTIPPSRGRRKPTRRPAA